MSRKPLIAALVLFGVAIVLVGLCGAWRFWVGPEPPRIVPPAGQVVEAIAPFRFAILGDNRGNMDMFQDILRRVVREDVQFIVHTGDLMRRCDRRQAQYVLHELAELKLPVPFCPVPGNHDLPSGLEHDAEARSLIYREAFGPRLYWVAWGHCLFVGFDTSTAACSADDLDWLERTLSERRGQYELCFVFMHAPPRDPRPGGIYGVGEGAEPLIAILRRHKVSAVFAGHIHSYAEDDLGGVPVYITGGAGATLVSPQDRHHYLICTVERDGTFRIEKEDVEKVRDVNYPEYVLLVKFPDEAVLSVAGLSTLAAVVMLLRARLSATRPEL